jgi:hypothetical protein
MFKGEFNPNKGFSPDFTGNNPRGTERAPLLDLRGRGVSAEEIARWKGAVAVNNYNERIKLEMFTTFLQGESRFSPPNQINNPLRLQRPTTLLSLASMLEENKTTDSPENRKKYVYAVRAFEQVAASVLLSLNETDPDKRREVVREQLSKTFNDWDVVHDKNSYLSLSKVNNPSGWLVYSVISVLDNPSEEITPVGRLRALELLQLCPTTELTKGFRGIEYNYPYGNGYDLRHISRLPYTFLTPEERVITNHDFLWQNNKKVKELLIRDSNKNIDWEATVNALNRVPEEAIQIALLLLHSNEATEGALSFLRSVPELNHEVKSKMFGEKATFLIEHKLAAGIDMAKGVKTANVAEGYLKNELAGKSAEELEQMLLEKDRLISLAEAQRGRVYMKNQELKRENTMLKTLRKNDELIRKWRQEFGSRKRLNPESQASSQDPEGYYKIYNLNPDAASRLSNEQISALVENQYKKLSSKSHPDKSEGDEEKRKILEEEMKKINAARDVLTDPLKRSKYGRYQRGFSSGGPQT